LKRKFTFKQMAMFLLVFTLVITTMLGILAVQQQKCAISMPEVKASKGTYISIFDKFPIINTREDISNSDFLKILLENALVIGVVFVVFGFCTSIRLVKNIENFKRLPVKEKVVLIE